MPGVLQRRSIRKARNISLDAKGMREAVLFLSFLKGSKKYAAIRKSYMIATFDYRKKLRADTPKSQYPDRRNSEGKRTKPLWKTVDVAPSKKYSKSSTLVDPLWVGHMVKKGAFHQHLIVRGTKAWEQDGSPLQRKARAGVNKGTRERQDAYTFMSKAFRKVTANYKAAQPPNDYVTPLANSYKRKIVDEFGDSFIRGMKKEAHSPKYKGVLSY